MSVNTDINIWRTFKVLFKVKIAKNCSVKTYYVSSLSAMRNSARTTIEIKQTIKKGPWEVFIFLLLAITGTRQQRLQVNMSLNAMPEINV